MPTRLTLLFSVTTDPADRSSASGHQGGWSESFWYLGSGFLDISAFIKWGNSRSNLLSGEATIIGYRQQLYTISGNKLLPGGAGSGVLNIPGAFPTDLNAPQDSLMMTFTLANQPTTLRHRLACLPDSQVTNGEYQPTTAYKTQVTNYASFIVASGWGSVTRDLTQPEARLKSITGAVITTLSATGAAAGDYIILRRVKGDDSFPVSGSFLVTAVVGNTDGSFAYTVYPAPPDTVSKPNGTVRKDVLTTAVIATGQPNRLVVRKVGRPFVLYRGRRSKRRV